MNDFLRNIYRFSEENALVIISFRDLTKELTGEHRFIPVKSDENRIHTCFLEYFPEWVRVTDLLHERIGGSWTQKISSYQKLRLNTEMLRNIFARNNFVLRDMELIKGLNYLIFQKK